MKDEPNEFLDFNKAIAFLGISKSTLYKLTSSKEIKFYKPRGKIFFRKDDLVAFITNPNKEAINTNQGKEEGNGN